MRTSPPSPRRRNSVLASSAAWRGSLKDGVIDEAIEEPADYNDEEISVDRGQKLLRQSSILLSKSMKRMSDVTKTDIGLFEKDIDTHLRRSTIQLKCNDLIVALLDRSDDADTADVATAHSTSLSVNDSLAIQSAFKILNGAMQEDNVTDNSDRLRHKTKLKEVDSMELLKNFMKSTGECVTWVEIRELWSDMVKTNNGDQPSLKSTWNMLLGHHCPEDGKQPSVSNLVQFARALKSIYSIRLSDDDAELRFILFSQLALYLVVAGIAITGYVTGNPDFGVFSWQLVVEALVLFFAELIWETALSWLVFRYNMKINYTRKLGNLFKVPKYFVADFMPFYNSTALSLFTSLALNQTLFALVFYRTMREKIAFFSYVFLSQDRREDRPDTLIFQMTEDLMRFSIYFPFKIFVLDYIDAPAIIFIPILINSIGDGLAEPVGVKWGKHKYTTTALYYKGKFWNGNFTRSYEGSSCVYITSVIVIAANYTAFSTLQFWLTVTILPFLMTIAEAKAPHTNDGPFLALIGCCFLTFMFFVV